MRKDEAKEESNEKNAGSYGYVGKLCNEGKSRRENKTEDFSRCQKLKQGGGGARSKRKCKEYKSTRNSWEREA